MKLNKLTAFLTALTLSVGQIIPAVASGLGEDISNSEEYTLRVQDAIYYREDFEGTPQFEKTGSGDAQVIFVDDKRGNALQISSETEVSYTIVGKSEKRDIWDGSASASLAGAGTEASPYLIQSGADLKLFANNVNSGNKYENTYFKLTKNIDLQNIDWAPIGRGSNSFSGTFDGGGYVISNVSINGVNGGGALGFFGNAAAGSLIKDLGLENVTVTFENTSSSRVDHVGGIIGVLYGKIKGCSAKNVTITNTSAAAAAGWVGGLVGRIRTTLNSSTDPVMSECYVVDFSHYTTVKSETSLVAPLFGQMHSSDNNKLLVENCYAAGIYFSDSTYYYQTGTGNQNKYTYAKNVYSGHGVAEMAPATGKKCDLGGPSGTLRVNVGNLKADKLKADLFTNGYTNDESGYLNGGFPYHTGRVFLPDESKVTFDINFFTSDEVSFKIMTRNGETCAELTVANDFEEGWHIVSVDMYDGKYDLYVDGQYVSEGTLLTDAGNGKVVFSQSAGNDYIIDNISVCKDFSEELSAFSEDLIPAVKGSEVLDNVTSDLYFPESFDDVNIIWTSSNDSIIDNKGRIDAKAVKLTTDVTAEFAAKAKSGVQIPSAVMNFNVSIAGTQGASDEDIVKDIALYYLKESVLTDESLETITHELTLPTEYEGATITWETSDSSFITEEGIVTQPEVDGEDADVKLTATISLNDVERTVEFDVIVVAPLSDESKVKLAANSIAYTTLTDEDVNMITKDLVLPKKGLFDSVITWESYNTNVIANNGKVTRPDENTFVQLKATVTLNDAIYERYFSFNVLISDLAAANEDAEVILSIPEEAEADFELPLVGSEHDSVISWESNDSAIVIEEDYATVIRPANEEGDKEVALTATIICKTATITKSFLVTVVKMPTVSQLVTDAKNSITWESISVDSIDSVKNNLSLATDFGNNVVAEWTSSPAGYIDENGVVNRPAFGSDDVSVTLTATVKADVEGVAPQQVSFETTIKAFESEDEALKKATNELSFPVISSDSIDAVVCNLYLPVSWRYGSTVTWTSTNEAYIRVSESDRTGYVTAPAAGSANETVTLTATISLGSKTKEKKFFITLAEPDSVKEVYFVDCEKYELGAFSDSDNINVNKNAYVKTSVEQSPTDETNKVFKITKNEFSPEYAQRKGYRLVPVGESKGKFEFTGKFYFEKLNDKSFAIIADFSTGEEISITFSKSENNFSVASKTFSLNEWHEIKIIFDTFEKVYSMYINDQLVIDNKDFKYKKEKTTEISYSRFWFDFVYTGKLAGEHTVYFDDLKLIKHISSQSTLTEAATRFETEFLAMNDIRNITSDLVFPEISLFETTIETTSSNPAVITNDGMVTRPVKGNAEVQLTVNYKNKYGNIRTKVFDLLVVGGLDEAIDNSVALESDVTQAVNYINTNHSLNYITSNLNLLFEGSYGSDITYISSDETVISNDGAVTRPSGKDKEITLTVVAAREGVSINRTVTLLVKKVTESGGGSSSSSGSSGGSSSVPKGDVSEILPNQTTESAPSAVFTDISTHWARTYIEEMYNDGIVNGKGDGTFDPDATVTREEFITMLVRTLGIDTTGASTNFADVSKDDWFAPFVNAAYKNNIVNGVSSDKFGIGTNISRQDMCVMVYNAIGEKLSKNNSGEAFADDTAIASYAKNAVYLLKENGVINGRGENTFAPDGTATRAEAAKIIYTIKNTFVEEKR